MQRIFAPYFLAFAAVLALTNCGGSNPPQTIVVSNPAQESMQPPPVQPVAQSPCLDAQAAANLLASLGTSEALEQALNQPGSINQCDRDGDGNADFVRVTESGDGLNRQVQILDVAVNPAQLIATLNLQLPYAGAATANVQFIGAPGFYPPRFVYSYLLYGHMPYFRYIYAPMWRPYFSPYRFGYYPRYYTSAPRRIVRRTVTTTTTTTAGSPASPQQSAPSSIANPDRRLSNAQGPVGFKSQDTSRPPVAGGFGGHKQVAAPPAASPGTVGFKPQDTSRPAVTGGFGNKSPAASTPPPPSRPSAPAARPSSPPPSRPAPSAPRSSPSSSSRGGFRK